MDNCLAVMMDCSTADNSAASMVVMSAVPTGHWMAGLLDMQRAALLAATMDVSRAGT